jgi:hypothetical protein
VPLGYPVYADFKSCSRQAVEIEKHLVWPSNPNFAELISLKYKGLDVAISSFFLQRYCNKKFRFMFLGINLYVFTPFRLELIFVRNLALYCIIS